MAIQVDVYDAGNDVLRVVGQVPPGDIRAAGTNLANGGTIVALGWVSALTALTTPQKQAYVTGLLKAARPDVLAPVAPTPPASGAVSYTV